MERRRHSEERTMDVILDKGKASTSSFARILSYFPASSSNSRAPHPAILNYATIAPNVDGQSRRACSSIAFATATLKAISARFSRGNAIRL